MSPRRPGPEDFSSNEFEQESLTKTEKLQQLRDEGWLDLSKEAERIAKDTGLPISSVKALTKSMPERETGIYSAGTSSGSLINPTLIPTWEALAEKQKSRRAPLEEAERRGWSKTDTLIKQWIDKYELSKTEVQGIVSRFNKPVTDYVSFANLGSRMSDSLAAEIEKEIAELAKVRGGTEKKTWLSSRTEFPRLAEAYGLTNAQVRGHATYLRTKRNDYIKATGSQDVKFSKEFLAALEMQLALHNKSSRELKDAEAKGWLAETDCQREIEREFKLTEGQVRSLIGRFRAEHKELAGEYVTTTLGVRMSPLFFSLIKKEAERIQKDIDQLKEAESKKYKDLRSTRSHLVQKYGLEEQQIKSLEILLKSTRKDYITANKRLMASEEFIATLEQAVIDFKNRKEESENVPSGWVTVHVLAKSLGRAYHTIAKMVKPYRETNPEWFKIMRDKTRKLSEHCSPELVAIVTASINERKGAKQDALIGQLERLAQDVAADSPTIQVRQFKSLLNLFGHANAVDILYKFHPEYKRLPIGHVKSILADYLGDFLFSKPLLGSLDNLEIGVNFLEDSNFQDYLFEVIKNDIIDHYHQARQSDRSASAVTIVTQYLDLLETKAAGLKNENLDLVCERLKQYYEAIFKQLEKPSHIIDRLGENREFPDFYQSINIQELTEKRKMLLADQMGLGKSASAILAKEYLGLRQALVVVPSNVLDTWSNYLSDKVDANGEPIGYFKSGQVPKVLIIEDFSQLKDIENSVYDYIVIAQERLTQKYARKLGQLDFDMLIIDEVHKLKNIRSGVRATTVLELAKKLEGPDKYLALLSGTPVPNKVHDIAIILKLLYPEEFGKIKDRELIHSIIYSDAIDLRSKLLTRMQIKELTAGVEMPTLEERLVTLELSEIEQLVYEVLVEADELEAPDKMRILRQFLLNPDLLDATPGIISTKIQETGKRLRAKFEKNDHVVMFVNDFIENVIVGDKAIVKKLGLPPDVEVKVIYRKVSKAERAAIQQELKQKGKKILLLVSGKTADVGVDFSGGDRADFYNEPWTEYDRRQQLGRVYRPGLAHDLESDTFITKNTIEEGIHLYIKAKERAIEKLLRGIPRTELENRLLEKDEKQGRKGLDVNPELAQYYFSTWDKMTKIFRYVKQIGEENFKEFLEKFGQDYASCYLNLGSRSYQANAARVSGAVIDHLVRSKSQRPEEVVVLDIASGPEMLKRHIPSAYQENVMSLDINKEHFTQRSRENQVVGSFLKLPFATASVDYANFALALHYTQLIPSKNNYERSLQTTSAKPEKGLRFYHDNLPTIEYY